MKNNIISSSQFCFSVFLSSLVTLLFIDKRTTYVQIFYTVIALAVNFLVIKFVDVKLNRILEFIYAVYFILISILVLSEFTVYMHSAIKSGPFWSILAIMGITIFFCSRKGFEAFARASVIIGFFVVMFCIYIVTATVKEMKFPVINSVALGNMLQPFVLLLPSAIYIRNKEYIQKIKSAHLVVSFVFTALFTSFCIFIASPVDKKFPLHYIGKISRIGVFRGGEFLFLVLITIGVIYFMLLSLQSLSGGCNNLSGTAYWIIILIFSLISLYSETVNNIFTSELPQTFVFIIMIVATLIYSVVSNYTHNKKIQQ